MDQIVQHITRRVDSFKADQDFQLELLKADLVAYVESRCASLVASSSSSSTSTSVDPTGSIPQPPTPLVVPQPANSVARSIDSLVQQPTALVQQLSDNNNSTTPSQSSTLFVNAEHSDPQTVPNCTVAQSTNAPSSSSEVVASTSNQPEQQQQQQQSNVIREGGVKIEIKAEDSDDEKVCQCDDMAHNLAPNGPASTSMALSKGASTCASSQRLSKSGCTRKRPLSVNPSNKHHHHHRSNKKPALTAQEDDEEDDDESDDDNHERNDDDDEDDSDYEEEDENDEEEQHVNLHDGDGVDRNQPSTSSGRKRKSTNQIGNKQKKTRSDGTSGSKYTCKFPSCGKSFPRDSKLAIHERIHLNIKPFSCTWPDCRHSAVRKGNVVEHVRTQHFKLPKLQKEQTRLNIVDNRNPEDYIRVDNQLLERRLE